ncbi:MFS general substrate transporter [Poronia punctata]|nr:MFS general substrate transporter [Poronia punctata]
MSRTETETETISLQDRRPADETGTADDDDDDEVPALPGSEARQAEASRKRAMVLLGASISQLPIWGFAMSYGVFQEYYISHWTLSGARDVTGVVGTTQNGVLYLSMPFLFAAFTRRYARHRRLAASLGAVIAAASFVLSSFSTHVWHLVATQGVLAALGCALMFSPTTLSLGEWFSDNGTQRGKRHRAIAYGVTLSCKNVVGSFMPFVAQALLEKFGFRFALRIWAGVALVSGVLSIALIPTHPAKVEPEAEGEGEGEGEERRRKNIPWHFLRHRTFYIYSVAIVLQSAGYGIPQTYLPSYAREVTKLSQTSATLLLTAFNVPGILASTMFGYLSGGENQGGNGNKRFAKFRPHLRPATVTAIPPLASAVAAFLLWGLTTRGNLALLLVFSATFGFFAGGYSATWGGVLSELEGEAARRNEAVDPGLLYGLLNGARGIGYVTGGLVSVPLLNAGADASTLVRGGFGISSAYGPLIVFTGLSSVFGGWGLVWKCMSSLRRRL